MSMRLLNQILGRSTIDSTIERAFTDGRIEELLTAYGFPARLSRELASLPAASFGEFATQAYQAVRLAEEAREERPQPADGLCQTRPGKAHEAAA